MLFLILLLIILIVLFIYFTIKYKKMRIDTINIISGGVGSGKTSSTICRVISLLRKIYFIKRPSKVKKDYVIISNFPIGKYSKKINCRYLKVFGHTIKCYDLKQELLTMQVKLPQNEVILIIDEFSNFINQFDYNIPVVKDNINEFFRNFRHYTNGLGFIFGLDQCSSNIPLQFRRKANYSYNFISSRKLFLLPIMIFDYRKIIISDEINNQLLTNDASNENDIVRTWFLCNPFKYFDSFCYSERYQIIKKIASLSSSKTLKRNDVMKLNVNGKIYYACLKYDKITKKKYLSTK